MEANHEGKKKNKDIGNVIRTINNQSKQLSDCRRVQVLAWHEIKIALM